MRLFRFRNDPSVDSLRWVMLAVMLVGTGLTLASQPPSFWVDPDSAVRADGLGIHNPTNHSFEFLLGHGGLAYLACSAACAGAAILLVSVSPRWPALVLLFTVILGQVYDGTNWLAIRWHGGMLASTLYGFGLGFPLARVIGRVAWGGPALQRRLGRLAAAALLVDMSCTLLGQPHSYWSDPGTAYEGNVVSRYFLIHGWGIFAVYTLVYALAIVVSTSVLPRLAALTVAFGSLFAFFDGASNWLFFVWRQGMEAVLAYACVLSVALVALVLGSRRAMDAPEADPGRRGVS
jgi:hypothetical protein